MNNFEKIKNMNINEMAEFLSKINCPQYDLLDTAPSCEICIRVAECEEKRDNLSYYIEWLESEAE